MTFPVHWKTLSKGILKFANFGKTNIEDLSDVILYMKFYLVASINRFNKCDCQVQYKTVVFSLKGPKLISHTQLTVEREEMGFLSVW